MARLIDADALMLYLNDIYFRNSPNGNSWRETLEIKQYRESVCEGLEMAMKSVEEAPTVCGWISVKDRLPEDYIKVLVAVTDVAGTFVAVVWREDNNWNDGEGGWPNEDVTHWMPFPEPPKEEEHEGC